MSALHMDGQRLEPSIQGQNEGREQKITASSLRSLERGDPSGDPFWRVFTDPVTQGPDILNGSPACRITVMRYVLTDS